MNGVRNKRHREVVDAPATYVGVLRPHQRTALGFALDRERAMLALDCGLGKTHIGIAYMLSFLPALVVCPASLKASWKEHILMFAPSAATQIAIVSYNKLNTQDATEIQCIVADEAHYLKHESSQRSKTFSTMATSCPRMLLMTGTPGQRNSDLFHLLKLLDPVRFRHFFHYGRSRIPGEQYFAEQYCKPQPVWIGGTRHGFKFTVNHNGAELARVCANYMLRMRKQDVVALPPLRRVAVSVGAVDNPHYFRKRWDEIADVRERKGSRRADVEMLALCRETSQLKVESATNYTLAWMEAAVNEKVILFYHHKDIGDQIVTLLQGRPHIRIDGKTTLKKRVGLLNTFRRDPGCRIGVLSMCATSTGLNLQFCTKIIFVEITFLSVHHTQAESRIHRIGQDRDVSVDYLILDGSTDDLLWRSLQAKRHTEFTLFDNHTPPDHEGENIVPL